MECTAKMDIINVRIDIEVSVDVNVVSIGFGIFGILPSNFGYCCRRILIDKIFYF